MVPSMSLSCHPKSIISPFITSIIPALIFTVFALPSLAWAGTYTDSAHGTNISRTTIADLGYATGNCAHCHEQHASIAGSAGTPLKYLGFGEEENLCFGCHGSGGAGVATDNVQSDITTKTTAHHDVVAYSDIHLAGESQADIAAASPHVECTDCHNPHVAGTGNHTPGTNAITAPSPLAGVSGVEPTFSSLNWTAPISYTEQTATKEYQICFKCHSGAVGDPASWSGTTLAHAWTDLGLEFSTANNSSHPVVAASGSRALTNVTDGDWSDQLLDPWGTNVGTQTMYCSDCHESSDSTVAGPHGSDYKWMLAGTNKAWPFTTAAANGDSSGTYRLIDTIFAWDASYQQGLGTEDGCFCWNCHPAKNDGNNVHSNGNHDDAYCVDCHIRVPHGGKVSRLIAAENNATYTNMPARYTASGTGNNTAGTTETVLRKYTKVSAQGYAKNRCYSVYTGSGGCSYHNLTTATESW